MSKLEFAEQDGFFGSVENALFAVDPRGQGFGLADVTSLNPHANKFFLLAGEDSIFVSPSQIPDDLLNYYDSLNLPIPAHANIHTAPSAADSPLFIDAVTELSRRSNTQKTIIPYMMTGAIESVAVETGSTTLVGATAVTETADKALFQATLAIHGEDIRREVGFDVVVPNVTANTADRAAFIEAYRELSANGTEDIVIVRPKSASALGIFIVRKEAGEKGVAELLGDVLGGDEAVLIEKYVAHTHAPSMQGSRYKSPYTHHYFGDQIITHGAQTVSYDGNIIPFDQSYKALSPYEQARLTALHEILGDIFLTRKGIEGIAGFDALINTNGNKIDSVKITEANLHLPGSIAVYAALRKLFPTGFSGVALNQSVPFDNTRPSAFFQEHKDLLVHKGSGYGVFPINMSYPDRVDLVFIGQDEETAFNMRRQMA